MTVYYEALCGDSKRFITTQLAPNYEAFKDYVNIQFVPYGKASVGFLFHSNFHAFSSFTHVTKLIGYSKLFFSISWKRLLPPMTVWNSNVSMVNLNVPVIKLIHVVYIWLQMNRLPLNMLIVPWNLGTMIRYNSIWAIWFAIHR